MKLLPNELVAGIAYYLSSDELEHIDTVFSILRTEYFQTIRGYTHLPFFACCRKGYAGAVRQFLEDPLFDPTAAYNYAINRSIERGRLEVVKLLIDDPRIINCPYGISFHGKPVLAKKGVMRLCKSVWWGVSCRNLRVEIRNYIKQSEHWTIEYQK